MKEPMALNEIHRILVKAGQNHKMVLVKYVKMPDGDDTEKKTYLVEPYSYRKDKFFGYDVDAKSIKAFNLLQIENVSESERKFKPRWPIELDIRKVEVRK